MGYFCKNFDRSLDVKADYDKLPALEGKVVAENGDAKKLSRNFERPIDGNEGCCKLIRS